MIDSRDLMTSRENKGSSLDNNMQRGNQNINMVHMKHLVFIHSADAQAEDKIIMWTGDR